MLLFHHPAVTIIQFLKLQFPEQPIIAIELFQMSLQRVNPLINTSAAAAGQRCLATTRPCALTHVSELPSWSQPRQFAIVATLSIQSRREEVFPIFMLPGQASQPGQPVFLMAVYSKCDFGQDRGNFTQKYVRRPLLLLLLWEERVFFSLVVVC